MMFCYLALSAGYSSAVKTASRHSEANLSIKYTYNNNMLAHEFVGPKREVNPYADFSYCSFVA
jgi:hypothetical protein